MSALPAGSVTGNGTGTLISVTAPLATINSALAGTTLTYQPTASFTGSDSLSLDVNDLGNTGVPGALAERITVAPITVVLAAVNQSTGEHGAGSSVG